MQIWVMPMRRNVLEISTTRNSIHTQIAVNNDLKRAYVWYRLSYENGDKDTEGSLKQVESELTPQQLAEAQQLFEQWKPGNCQIDLMHKVSSCK